MGRGSSGAGGGGGKKGGAKAAGLNSQQLADALVKATNETEDRFDLTPKVRDLLEQAEPGATLKFMNIQTEDEFGWPSTYSYKVVKRADGQFDTVIAGGKHTVAEMDSYPYITQSLGLTAGELTNALWDRAGKE